MTDKDVPAAPAPPADTGITCLVMLARLFNIAACPEQLRREFADDGRLFGVQELLLAAGSLGLEARRIRCSATRLDRTPLPAIAEDACGGYFIIAKAEHDQVLIFDPAHLREETLSLDQLKKRWQGGLLLVRAAAKDSGTPQRFGFTWFFPALIKHRKLLGEVLLVSMVLQVFGLVTPLFFQVVMDKVLVHRGLTTLDVIAIGLLAVMCFETVLSGLRTYIFAHTASRIDVELGARLFRHLLSLPLAYFQARRVGDSVARVRELENIRSFLTGNCLTVVLDVVFSVVFLVVMAMYSLQLTALVVLSLPLYFLVSLLVTPLLRIRLNESFDRGAQNQAFLVESISGIDTLKSMAVEPQTRRCWDNQLAAYVGASFRTQNLSTLANESVGLIGKLVTVATLWLGARLVMSGDLSVGQLVAFNLLAGRVSQPIMRLAQLWTQFQQIAISTRRLGDILNTHPEAGRLSRTPMPVIAGQIEFENVCFRYRPEMEDALSGVSFSVAPGEVLGVVGRSGSGKSTLAKLVQCMHSPQQGSIRIDGMDLAMVDCGSLRRQIGVVLQDNRLFQRSIRDNIALADPGAPLEAIVQAAKLSGAHEFILQLPQGYDTSVGEQGASLSGGQRQRIAIARALMGDPRILVFDEATSALDYESERIVQDNMRSICRGRTVIIIAHRLSAVRDADRIVVMDRGAIVEEGSHQALIDAGGQYARLRCLQQGGQP
ncbi:type I secretion system permease/ATPase [Pseudomonas sp.]|uniref:type I secretion system permease/ATPase n=1 Tax=Pseudomonas sp. TaxID=306 RepID=UPI0025876F95|nr:type I secretion system permease/ATPase [Pseudomonas sp.]